MIRGGIHELREYADRRKCIRLATEIVAVVFLIGMVIVAKMVAERAQAEYRIRNERVIAE